MNTKEIIQTSINSRLITAPTRIEGGTMQDIIGSVSYELANIVDTKIEPILDNAFITTSDEEHLLIRGSELGILKKEALCAYVMAEITGLPADTLVKAGFKAHTDDGIVFQSVEDVTSNSEGIAVVKMQCLERGTLGNIAINTLNNFSSDNEFINAEITNPKEGYDGYEEESIEEYRQRILEYIRDNAINSNIADYQKWAKSVNGVNKVVIEDAFIAGAGKVNVYISAFKSGTPSVELIEAVKNVIKKEQIINADVSVSSLDIVEIDVSASLVLKNGVTVSYVKDIFETKLNDYLENASGSVSYLYISNLFFEIDGVIDVSNYLLNTKEDSIALTHLQAAHLNSITLLEA